MSVVVIQRWVKLWNESRWCSVVCLPVLNKWVTFSSKRTAVSHWDFVPFPSFCRQIVISSSFCSALYFWISKSEDGKLKVCMYRIWDQFFYNLTVMADNSLETLFSLPNTNTDKIFSNILASACLHLWDWKVNIFYQIYWQNVCHWVSVSVSLHLRL